jgi:UDP-glucose 4-epimerase
MEHSRRLRVATARTVHDESGPFEPSHERNFFGAADAWELMGALIVGGSGFIGRHLASALVAQGEDVRIASRHSPQWPTPRAGSGRCHWVAFDVMAESGWDDLLADYPTIYHLAWSTIPASSNRDRIGDVETNVVGSLRLIEAVIRRGSGRVVFVSSAGTVYGRLRRVPVAEDHPNFPICAYGVSKLAVEKYLHLSATLDGLHYTVLRVSNPYGPGQQSHGKLGAISTFVADAIANRPIVIWGDGSVIRDYVHVSDVVSALMLAGSGRGTNGTYNIGSGHGTSLNQLVDAIRTLLNGPLVVHYRDGRPYDVPVNVLDIEKAQTELGWVPRVPLLDGLSKMITELEGAQENTAT